MSKIGVSELVVQLLAKQHGWAGHVARMNDQHLVAQWSRVGTLEQWNFLRTVCNHEDAGNKTRWRHAKCGRKIRWEANLAEVYGDSWRTDAMCRHSWRAGRQHFIDATLCRLLGVNHKVFGMTDTS
eukprot:11912340-Karenia_brevis.AAC.1